MSLLRSSRKMTENIRSQRYFDFFESAGGCCDERVDDGGHNLPGAWHVWAAEITPAHLSEQVYSGCPRRIGARGVGVGLGHKSRNRFLSAQHRNGNVVGAGGGHGLDCPQLSGRGRPDRPDTHSSQSVALVRCGIIGSVCVRNGVDGYTPR